MTRRTKIVLGGAALIVAGLLVTPMLIPLSRPSVEYTDQATIRAAMKWPPWKIIIHRVVSLVPPLLRVLYPTVDVNASLMELRVSPDLVASNLLSSVPDRVTNSVRAWVLTPVQLGDLKAGIRNSKYVGDIGNPRVTTTSGVGSTLSTGKSKLVDGNRHYAGIEVDVYPKTRGGDIRLLAHIQLVDSTLLGKTGMVVVSSATNLKIGLRASFPAGGGVFVLDHKSSNAVLISASSEGSSQKGRPRSSRRASQREGSGG